MPHSTHSTHLTYRPDIDGLRALAILLVVIFHAFPKFLRGGFIGVDIFFVISGYLITSIIIRGQNQGNFSLLEFYSRRIKRIFPALIVVLVFCLIVGWYVLFADEYQQLGKHIAAGSVYLSNIVLESESGYFDTDAERKPLLHLWSLGIEEQFYLVFPLLLIFSYRFNFNPFLTILLCLVASFALNVTEASNRPTEVFFYPYTRAWELLVGSFIAFNHHQTIQNKAKSKNFLSFDFGYNSNLANGLAWFGFVLIFVAWIFFDNRKIIFPSWWALIPTLGAACLILAGEKAWFNRKILASKLAVSIGLISYPLYLWHWVLLSFVNITEMESPSASLKITVLITSVTLAWGTHFFVEKKLRFQKPKAVSMGLFVCLAFVGTLGYLVLQQNGYPNRYVSDPSFVAGEIGNGSYKAKGWLSSKACVDKYAKIAFGKYPDDEFCLIQNPKTPPTALLIGDSHANHLYSGLLESIELTGGNLLNLGGASCFPFFDNPLNPNKKCRQLINQTLEMVIATPSIKTIILTSQTISEFNEKSFVPKIKMFNFSSPKLNAATNNDPYFVYQNGMRKTLQRLLDAQKRLIFVLDIPGLEFEPMACVTRPWRLNGIAAKTPCAVPRAQVDARRKKYLEMVTKVLHDYPTVKVWDTLPALCDKDYCWAIKENKMLYRDNNHLNEIGAIYLGNHLHIL